MILKQISIEVTNSNIELRFPESFLTLAEYLTKISYAQKHVLLRGRERGVEALTQPISSGLTKPLLSAKSFT